MSEVENPELKDNFDVEKYSTFKEFYEELPSNENIIKTWYMSDWIIKKLIVIKI